MASPTRTTPPPTTEQLLEEFAAYLKHYGRKPATIESYTTDTQGFVDYVLATFCGPATTAENSQPREPELDWRQLGSAHLIHYQEYLVEHDSAMANSVRRKTLAIRQFFRFLANEELLPDCPVENVPVPKRDDDLPENLHYKAIGELVSSCRSTKGGASLKWYRDNAILALLALEGLKSTEAINLIWSHHRDRTDNPAGYLHIGGQRKRTLVLSESTRSLLGHYKAAYFAEAALCELDALDQKVLVSFKGPGGGLISPSMTRHGLKFLLYEIGHLRGIDSLNAEMLRHYCIRYHLEQGMAPEQLMEKLGLKRMGVISRHIRRLDAGGAS